VNDAMSPSLNSVLITSDAGVFQLVDESYWIWTLTCPMRDCPCRLALILASDQGREALLSRGACVFEAWKTNAAYTELAKKLTDLVVFYLDIDTTEVFSPHEDEPLNLAQHPKIDAIVSRMDGDLLDEMGRLWYQGKGWPDPEVQALSATQIKTNGWAPGTMLAWDDALTGVRQDLYPINENIFEAVEMYCPIPGCDCGEVVVSFGSGSSPQAKVPGHVVVSSGTTRLEANKDFNDCLTQLWAMFQKRHPRYLARFARRYPIMKSIGAKIVAKSYTASAKIGRNDPCPCGSGKKYKKCCAA
jgi:hypothetical protein